MFWTLHWGRILLAAVLSEVGVIAVLLISIAVYSKVIAPGMSATETQTLGELVGYYVAPTAGFVTTLAAALWVTRGLESEAIISGILVGILSVVIALPFAFTAKEEHRFMYGIAFAARLI